MTMRDTYEDTFESSPKKTPPATPRPPSAYVVARANPTWEPPASCAFCTSKSEPTLGEAKSRAAGLKRRAEDRTSETDCQWELVGRGERRVAVVEVDAGVGIPEAKKTTDVMFKLDVTAWARWWWIEEAGVGVK